MDDERLKNPDGRVDYFNELLIRIRDIRASEKRFYQKIRDLFKLSVDIRERGMRGRALMRKSGEKREVG